MVALRNGSGRGVNPQEPTIPEEENGENGEDHSDSSGDKPQSSSKPKTNKRKKKSKRQRKKDANSSSRDGKTSSSNNINNNNKSPPVVTMKKRKKRNRVVRLANVDDDCLIITDKSNNKKKDSPANSGAGCSSIRNSAPRHPPSIPLPMNQYKTTLCRRAIRKRTTESNPPSPSRVNNNNNNNNNNSERQKKSYSETTNSDDDNDDDDDLLEEYGDISLGMKLSVVAGKVIVQNLNNLSDGRASPAQTVGVIQRGDVLLSIDNFSLVHLPIDLLMERLKPLSTPDATGAYQRILHLRLAAGEGLDLLRKFEAAEARKAQVSDEAATEVFSLFPMVDQLSGIPLFDNHNTNIFAAPPPPAAVPALQQPQQYPHQRHDPHQHQEEKKQTEEDPATPEKGAPERQHHDTFLHQGAAQTSLAQHANHEKSLDEKISSDVAYWITADRHGFISEFFAWNEQFSELLGPSAYGDNKNNNIMANELTEESTTATTKLLTRSEMLELGRKAMIGANNLGRAMENIDRGKDMRSFRSWNSSVSLRSRASARRRYVLDAVSLPARMMGATATMDRKSMATGGGSDGGLDGISLATDNTSDRSDMEDVDGDELLLRLAAHDEIWRSQVMEALEKARDNLDNESEVSSEDEEDNPAANDDINTAITKELGAFLFGETMAKIVNKKKKSKALPPAEITAVLFDLSTNLASTMPDEVALGGCSSRGCSSSGSTLKSILVPFMGRKRPEAGSSVILATRFVLGEALVVWLHTFRPLPWESRRVLWPRANLSPSSAGDSRAPSAFSDADSLTVDSGSASPSSSSRHHHTKDLREQIEDQELDVETRAEACFLVTYYFTQRLLPRAALSRNATSGLKKQSEGKFQESRDLVEFVKKFGAYMKLHTCLAYAAALKFSNVIHELLELAEHDLRHREVIKLFSKRNALILYEPTMLSAIVQCLPLIRKESNAERRQSLVDICVSAYPDLCPWQVKQALLEFDEQNSASDSSSKASGSDLKELYYYYLSNLLHPHAGHDAARHDAALVEEWCMLSLDSSSSATKSTTNARRNNFFSVASRSSSDHLAYYRDLVMLLRLSMASREYDLALDLAGEIIDSHPTKDDSVLALVLQYLREIAHNSLDWREEMGQNAMFRSLKRVVRLFHQMSTQSTGSSKQCCISVPDELHALLKYKEASSGRIVTNSCDSMNRDVLDLIYFLAKEALPQDFLQAFATWCANHQTLSDTVHVLQSVLMKGTRLALNAELSGSLLRLRRARQKMDRISGSNNTEQKAFVAAKETKVPGQTVWSLMSKGRVNIDK